MISIITLFPATVTSVVGTLASNEDFVLTSAKLAILETTISNYNESSFKFITPTSVLTWIRSQVAHRSANTAVSWAKTFARFDSGTYNNQWSIVDYKKFSPHKPLPSTGLLHVLEQLPYFSSIFSRSGSWKFVQKFGDWFTYEGNPRALIFARDQSTVADMKTLRKLMRSNDYQHDPLSRCNCTPPYSGENAISCRSDLNPPNGTYPFPALGFRDHGATDMKATNVSLMATQLFEGISGPTYDPLPIFDWNTTPLKENVSHIGQPLQFRFPPVVHRWPSRPNSATVAVIKFFQRAKLQLAEFVVVFEATNVSLMATQLFEGISGPTYDPLPIFDWNTTPLKENVSHIGQPLQFRFPPVVHRWPSRPNSLHY
uniref:Phospholipase B-like n=1 Tax=Ascaris lumbricoides TaxID=6252 RepID=A0A0M3IS46_ASCLU